MQQYWTLHLCNTTAPFARRQRHCVLARAQRAAGLTCVSRSNRQATAVLMAECGLVWLFCLWAAALHKWAASTSVTVQLNSNFICFRT
jgi:hypothetical protein